MYTIKGHRGLKHSFPDLGWFWELVSCFKRVKWSDMDHPVAACTTTTHKSGTRDQISWAFPLCICLLQVINDWRWEWPGNEVNVLLATV